MTTNCDVTLFHFDEDTETFTATYFPRAYVDIKRQISKSGIKQKGFYSSDKCIVRIPALCEIGADAGDYIHIGKSDSLLPDRENDLKIIAISDNRKGTSPHFRLSCGG